jgi:signal transduction histidine kinase
MKLLKRTVRNYIIYSILLLVVCTPIYYVSIQHLFVVELEEELFHHKQNFIKTANHLQSENDLRIYQLINEEFLLNKASRWPLIDSLYSYSEYDSIAKADIPFRALRTGVVIHEQPYELIIRESIVGNTKLVTAIVVIQIILLILLLVGLALINRKLSKVVWNPFYIILEKLKQYQIDKDLAIELPHSSTLEFRDLSEAIVQLVNKSRDAYLSQKEFTENASHELQTPLAIIRTKLELLIQDKAITQDQAEIISGILDATDRIARLNKNLLLLSKIENRQFLLRQEIEVQSVLLPCLELYKQMAQEKKVKIVTQVDSKAFVNGSPILFDILLSNLISNALRHSHEQSEIVIKIDSKSLQISNPGEPLKYPDKIFERFNRESRNNQGNGLGLAIVKKICDVEGFIVTYRFTDQNHVFSVTFNP